MAANTVLNITETDFDEIKSNLKTFLRSQTEFSDYDFDGSAMNVFLDVLAYNTHYMAFYANMLANESFIDSALLRPSVVSRAKLLGYTPRSTVGSTATITVQITPNDSPASITIPQFTEFTTEIDDVTYTFSTNQAFVVTPDSNGEYIQTGIDITEGTVLNHRYTVDNNTSQRYILPNDGTDIRSISVTVQESVSNMTTTKYTRATDITDVSATSTVYFVEETETGEYELLFGDGVLGKALKNGNIINIRYRVANGVETNGASNFTAVGTIEGYGDITVTLEDSATGGAERETIDSIKFSAPRLYSTQNRAVTAKDYQRIILRDNPDMETVIAWGGEDSEPPIYGKVFLSMKPYDSTFVSEARKASIIQGLEDYAVMAIEPVIIDPIFLNVKVDSIVYYNKDKTEKTANSLKGELQTEIYNCSSSWVNKFNKVLRKSSLSRKIVDYDDSILSEQTTFVMYRKTVLTLGASHSYFIDFANPLSAPDDPSTHERHRGHIPVVYSEGFTYQGNLCYLKDDGGSKLYIYTLSDTGAEVILVSEAGTVDYDLGHVYINSFAPTAINSGENFLKIFGKPKNNDIIPHRNYIITIEEADVNVTMTDQSRLEE